MIVKTSSGYQVKSEGGKNLSKEDKARLENAKEKLRAIFENK